jgi:starch synthase
MPSVTPARRPPPGLVSDASPGAPMRITILTNEYPPHVYGGAGVHVEYLTRELARLDGGRHRVAVLCFGEQSIREGNLTVQGVGGLSIPCVGDPRHGKFLDALGRDLAMTGQVAEADIVHCHTWYTHLAGCLVQQLVGARLVLTTHSLEPHRPWKAEQLGTAYQASTWVERTAYQNADGVIAVSTAMREDVQSLYGVPADRVRVIPNGIDPNQYRPTTDRSVLARYGIDPARPYVLFVGRITRQKGILHLVNAIPHLRNGVQVVLCAGAPDTEEIGREMAERVEQARAATANPIVWVRQMVPREDVIPLYSQAALFVCPSVYEPFGIINLEAMACGTPVVASAVGGIPEVVVPGETGLLVPFEPRARPAELPAAGRAPLSGDDFEPRDPDRFARELAEAIDILLEDPERRAWMGQRARERVEQYFSWASIARRTLEFYQELLGHSPTRPCPAAIGAG